MRTPIGLLAAILGCTCACGGGPPPAATSPPAPLVAGPAQPVPAPSIPPTARVLPRSAVQDVVSQGLGSFLRHVELDDQPALVGGKFHGFRIASLHGGAFWNGLDLAPGDVVTSVNGLPIERPEQAQAALEAVAVASELRVAYERNGQPRELVVRIADGR